MELIDRLARSTAQTGVIVHATSPGQFDLPTPCSAWDHEVGDEGLRRARQTFQPEMRGDFFGPEVPAPDGADAMTRLVAFLGRRP